MLDVRLDGWLREFGPRTHESLEADSVEHLLDALEERYPRLKFKLRDESGKLRPFIRVFVDGEDVSANSGVAASLAGVRTVAILHSIAGG
jgi:molybdopterin synthase sulfur carrier subunit